MNFRKFFIIFLICFISISHICISLADDEDFEQFSGFIETTSNFADEPVINSKSAIVFDRNSGQILFEKNENEQRKMASTTKIMTAIVVIENSNLSDIVTVSKKSAGTGGSRLGLHTNDKISVKNLLYGLLLCSGNDAAVALAEYIGGSIEGFAVLMNNKCQELGLKSTHFVTPHGLDNDNHFTTAYELALITNYALKNEIFYNIVGTKSCSIMINNYSKSLSNTNELLGILNGVYGVKTGFTNGANRCLVTSIKRGNVDVICVVLGADTKKDRTNDSVKLIEYTFYNFESFNIKEKVLSEFENWKNCNPNFNIKKGVSNNVELALDDLPYDFLSINKNSLNSVSINIYCNDTFDAPLLAGSQIGSLTVGVDNKTVITLNITCNNNVEKKNIYDFYLQLLGNYIYHLHSIFFN